MSTLESELNAILDPIKGLKVGLGQNPLVPCKLPCEFMSSYPEGTRVDVAHLAPVHNGGISTSL